MKEGYRSRLATDTRVTPSLPFPSPRPWGASGPSGRRKAETLTSHPHRFGPTLHLSFGDVLRRNSPQGSCPPSSSLPDPAPREIHSWDGWATRVGSSTDELSRTRRTDLTSVVFHPPPSSSLSKHWESESGPIVPFAGVANGRSGGRRFRVKENETLPRSRGSESQRRDLFPLGFLCTQNLNYPPRSSNQVSFVSLSRTSIIIVPITTVSIL